MDVDVDTIRELRSCPNPTRRKELKLSLQQATISGVFSPSRSAENLVKHSGLICVDVDRKDNLHIENFDTLIDDVFSRLDQVAFASRSVSGNGYFLIIPLLHPDRHREHFDQLVTDFANMGITIDRACADVCRLRCQSYDLRQHVNLSATPYSRLHLRQTSCGAQPVARRRFVAGEASRLVPRTTYLAPFESSEARVSRLFEEISMRHIDLTASYSDWFYIGASLASLGEPGRRYFHLVSQQNPKYDPLECDRKFDQIISADSPRSVGIGTFIYLCRQSGLT